MLAVPTVAVASESIATATGWPWKLPPDTMSPSSGSTIGLSETAFSSISRTPRANPRASRVAPWTCGAQRSEYASCTRCSLSRWEARIGDAVQEAPEVRRARGLTGMRPQTLEPIVERRVRPQGGLDRHRRDDVGGAKQRREPLGRERPDRQHPLGPVHERESFFRLQRERRQPARCIAPAAGSVPTSVSTSPAPISGSARFASGARSPDAPSDPCSGTDGDHVGVQHLHHEVHELGAHARVPQREDVRAEEQHRARLGA